MLISRTSKFLSSFIFTLLLRLILIVNGFLIPYLIINRFGSETNGIILSITQIITSFSLVEFGASEALISNLYKPLKDNNFQEINIIVSTGRNYYNKVSIFVLIILIIGMMLYPFLIAQSQFTNIELSLLFFVIGFSAVIEFYSLTKYSVLLTADQKTYIISIFTIIFVLLKLLFFGIAYFLNLNLIMIFLLSIIPIIIRSILIHNYVTQNYPKLLIDNSFSNKVLKGKNDLVAAQLISTLLNLIPILILSFFIKDLKLLSVFGVYNLIFSGIKNIIGIFKTGLTAGFGELINFNKEKLLKAFNDFLYFFSYLNSVIHTITLFVIGPFIVIYTSNISDIDYSNFFLAILLIVNSYYFNAQTPFRILINPAKLFKEARRQSIIEILLALSLTLTLSYYFSLVGLVIGLTITNFTRYLLLRQLVYINVLHFDFNFSFLYNFKFFLLAFVFHFLIAKINFQISNIFDWFFMSSIIFAIISFFYLIFDLFFFKVKIHNFFIRVKRFAKLNK